MSESNVSRKIDNLRIGNDLNIKDDLTVGGDVSVTGTCGAGNTTITGTCGISGATTFTTGAQSSSVAVTATSNGSGTGTIVSGTSFVTVSSTNDSHIVVLPAPVVGNIIHIINPTSKKYELKSNEPATVKINTVASKQLSIAGNNTLIRCICTSSTTWIVTKFDTEGASTKGGQPD